jgi:hypothetical protein
MALQKERSLESWIWDAACSIRGAKDGPKYKDYTLPLIFTKRLGLDDVEADIIGKNTSPANSPRGQNPMRSLCGS